MRAIDVHHVLLIARPAVPGALEDEAFAVVAEIRLGVLAPVGQLSHVAKVRFPRFGWNADGKLDYLGAN
jgi:hypothetical protein